MDYNELKSELKEIEKAHASLDREERTLYKRYIALNAPLKLSKYERITINLRVTEETHRHLTAAEKRKKKNKPGREYSVTGCFIDWFVNDNGELRPSLFGDITYSRYDEILSIEKIDQIDGHCSKCRKYQDGYCYAMGGKTIGTWCATHKVSKNDFTCPIYEEMTELWRDGKHYPNVTHLKHKREYRIYSLDWNTYTRWDEDIINSNYQKDCQDLSS